MKMKKTTPTKNDLFSFLDIFTFDSVFDVNGAIEQFFRESVEKNEDRTPSRGELAYFQELAEEYIKDRGLEFDEENGLTRDTNEIIEAYENKIEQYADYYNENY